MLLTRVVTAVIGMVVAFFLVNYGNWPFMLVISALALVAWHEYSIMLRNTSINVSSALGAAIVLLLVLCACLGNMHEIVLILTAAILAVFVKAIIKYAQFTVTDAAFTLLGVLYIGILFAHLVALRFSDISMFKSTGLESGAIYLWIAFLGTWASDTFAYLVGCRYGKHKLCPLISPGKTIEGSIGGLIGCILVVTGIGYMWDISVNHTLLLGLLIGITAQLGDLAESAVKRYAGVKDSGRLLPGHGGVLDRFDSVLFVTPVVYYYVTYFLI